MNRKEGYTEVMENLRRLRCFLPVGYMGMITKKFGVTKSTVSNALLGKTRRFDIIEYAI